MEGHPGGRGGDVFPGTLTGAGCRMRGNGNGSGDERLIGEWVFFARLFSRWFSRLDRIGSDWTALAWHLISYRTVLCVMVGTR